MVDPPRRPAPPRPRLDSASIRTRVRTLLQPLLGGGQRRPPAPPVTPPPLWQRPQPQATGRLVQPAPSLADDTLANLPGARVRDALVSLSLDGGRLRVVQTLGRRLVGWGYVPLGEPIVRGGQLYDAVRLSSLLEELFQRRRLPRRRVRMAIPALGSASTILPVPWLPDDELGAAVTEEATRQLGYTDAESYLFWQPVAGRRRERQVFVLTVPREPILLTLEAFERADLELVDLDLRPMAMMRAVNQRDAVIACLEADSVDVMAVVDDLPVFVRSTGLSRQSGQRSGDDVLLSELGHALAVVEERVPARTGGTAVPVYLCGEAANGSAALLERVRLRLGRAPGTVYPPLYVPSGVSAAEYVAAIGMALKEL